MASRSGVSGRRVISFILQLNVANEGHDRRQLDGGYCTDDGVFDRDFVLLRWLENL